MSAKNSLQENKLFAQRVKQLEFDDDSDTSSSEEEEDDEEEEDEDEEEEESSDDPLTSNPGRIKNLAGFFSAQSNDPKTFSKKRLQIDEGPDSSSTQPQSTEPEEIDRKNNSNTDNQKPVVIDEGHAKNLASLFQNKSLSAPPVAKKPFRINLKTVDANRDENDSKSSETEGEISVPESLQSRRINYIAGTLAALDDTKTTAQKQKLKFDRPSVIELFEKKPALGVDDSKVEPLKRSQNKDSSAPEGGRRRSMAERWQQQQLEQEKESSRSDGGKSKPAWLIELETTKDQEPTIYENEPEVRDDVIRADDEQPDVISAQCTRKMRQLWSSIEQVGIKSKEDVTSKQAAVQSKRLSTQPGTAKSTEESSSENDDDDDDDEDDDDDSDDDDSDESDKDDKYKVVPKTSDEKVTSGFPVPRNICSGGTHVVRGVSDKGAQSPDGSGIVLAGASLLHFPKKKGS